MYAGRCQRKTTKLENILVNLWPKLHTKHACKGDVKSTGLNVHAKTKEVVVIDRKICRAEVRKVLHDQAKENYHTYKITFKSKET